MNVSEKSMGFEMLMISVLISEGSIEISLIIWKDMSVVNRSSAKEYTTLIKARGATIKHGLGRRRSSLFK